MKLLLVAAFFMFAALAKAQKPLPCAAPKEFEGRLFQSSVTKGVVTHILGKLSYDADNERLRIVGEAETAGKKSFFDVIILYHEEKIYTVYLDDKNTTKCTVSDYKEPFQPIEIPDNTTFQTEAYVGSSVTPETGVLVYIFGGEVPTGSYVVTVTAEGCIPVYEEFRGKGKSTRKSNLSRYFDVVLGIEDPERFIPPSICDKEAEGVAYSPINLLRRR